MERERKTASASGPVDVPIALLGYGTVGAEVNRLLSENADEIERATGYRLRVVKALVRDLAKERAFPAAPGVLTTDFAEIVADPAITLVAEVAGGVEEIGEQVVALLRQGRSVVTANKQLLARRWADLFQAAAKSGAQLRFEASVCAAIPCVKVLRESLVSSHVHRVLGIVNGTTNFILTRMEEGADYAQALAEAQRLGYAEADPSDDVSGADAAAKMAILASLAFGSLVAIDDVHFHGVANLAPRHIQVARDLDAVIRLIGQATLVDGRVDVRVSPALVDRHHPLAAVEGAFNAVMLQGDAIREIVLQGPGAGGVETASAVVADLVAVLGTTPGFLQGDPCYRSLPLMDPGELASPYYLHLEVADQAGVLAKVAERLAAESISVARLVQSPTGGQASLDIITHEASARRVGAALARVADLPEVKAKPEFFRMVERD